MSTYEETLSVVGHVDYACEHDDVERSGYRVTHHDGTVAICHYCADCAALAEIDWNGETAKIEAVS